MNERIRQLAEQVGYKSTRWNTTEQFEQFLDEFARSIVGECADIAHYLAPTDESAEEIRNGIKQHFGVK